MLHIGNPGTRNKGTKFVVGYVNGDKMISVAVGAHIAVEFESFWPSTLLSGHTSSITAFDWCQYTGMVFEFCILSRFVMFFFSLYQHLEKA